ncbi:MAG: hypothetical protein EHM85_05820 [Desulfobacteraceae bacterium]|nr:MAG: hypothetical protein EHM85_05820 [Desulfobacteraceae bacterium]
MEGDQGLTGWLTGWKSIGKYIGKSAKTARNYAKYNGMPFFRDPGGRPIAKPAMIDEYILDLNKGCYHRGKKPWQDEGVDNAICYAEEKEKAQADFDKQLLEAQRPTRSRF